MFHALFVLSKLAIVGVLAAIAAALLKRWTYARVIAKVLTIGSLVLIATFVPMVAIVLVDPSFFSKFDDPSEHARAQVEVVSVAINCGAFFAIVVAIAGPIWSLSSRRLGETR